MRMLMMVCLVLGSFVSPAVQAAPSEVKDPIANRAEWQSKQALVRVLIEVAVERPDHAAEKWWGFWERSPEGRYRLIQIEGPNGKPYSATYVQGPSAMVQAKGETHTLAAPWMMGHFLVGQPIEPSAFFDWMFALPGPDFLIGAVPSEVKTHNDIVVSINQSGWDIVYTEWSPAAPNAPALPSKMSMMREGVVMTVEVKGLETFEVLPADYTAFNLR